VSSETRTVLNRLKAQTAGDGVWLRGYDYSKIERDKVQIQARPHHSHFVNFCLTGKVQID